MTIKPGDVLDSDAAFRNSFDPRHPSYHNGDPTPVPTGGSRIPEGCTEGVSEPAAQSKDEDVTNHHQYQSVLHERERVGVLKTKVAKASKLVGVVSQQQDLVKDADGTSAEKLQTSISEIQSLLETYSAHATSAHKAEVQAIVEAAVQQLQTVPTSKEAYGTFILEINKLGRQLFAVQTKLLKELKEIKASLMRKN